jgi:GGDEF domain-containing protein
VAQRVREAVSTTTVPTGSTEARGSVGVSASVGVCTVPSGAVADLETVLTRADDAQYQAKRLGGDRVAVANADLDTPDERCAGERAPT